MSLGIALAAMAVSSGHQGFLTDQDSAWNGQQPASCTEDRRTSGK